MRSTGLMALVDSRSLWIVCSRNQWLKVLSTIYQSQAASQSSFKQSNSSSRQSNKQQNQSSQASRLFRSGQYLSGQKIWHLKSVKMILDIYLSGCSSDSLPSSHSSDDVLPLGSRCSIRHRSATKCSEASEYTCSRHGMHTL
jgi:hypothetical protein